MNRKLSMDELNRPSIDQYKDMQKAPVNILLDNIRSFNNVGSVFRTSDAFKIGHIYLCGITPSPPHREIQKTALGATESVEWSHHEDTFKTCKSLIDQGSKLVVIEQTTKSIPLREYIPDSGRVTTLVFGNEVSGVGKNIIELADESVQIQQYGTKHSLNISVCAGIVLWDVYNKLHP